MIRNNFCLDDLSQKCHLGRQEGGVTIDDDTGVTLMEFPDIQYNISSHSGQLLLKKYCRKSALTASSPRFSPSGTWASTTTTMGSGPVPTPSSWSSPTTWALATSSRSLQSIIFAQWASEYCSFSAFYSDRWRKTSKTARSEGTTPILMGPMLLISYYIYLTIPIEFREAQGLFKISPILQ